MEPCSVSIVIAAGGSGGHVIPAEMLAVRLTNQGCFVTILGHNVEQNPFFSAKSSIKKINILASPLSVKMMVSFCVKNGMGFAQAFKILRTLKPHMVVGFGSYHSFPVLLAALIRGIPIALYEANTTMGKVIKLFAPKAKLIASPFDLHAHFTNFIHVKPLIKEGDEEIVSKSEALAYFQLTGAKKSLLIMGGSQGAEFFNETCLDKLLSTLDPLKWQVIHLAGKKGNVDKIRHKYQKAGYDVCVKLYEERMSLAYLASDLILSRSGATTLFEMAKYQKSCILIPYPGSKDKHQLLNAQHFIKHHPGLVLKEELFNDCDLLTYIEQLTKHPKDNQLNFPFFVDTPLDQKVLELCSTL